MCVTCAESTKFLNGRPFNRHFYYARYTITRGIFVRASFFARVILLVVSVVLCVRCYAFVHACMSVVRLQIDRRRGTGAQSVGGRRRVRTDGSRPVLLLRSRSSSTRRRR